MSVHILDIIGVSFDFYRCWFIRRGADGCVEWTHPLYALTPAGRAMRLKLVTYVGVPAAEQPEGWEEFTDEVRNAQPHLVDPWTAGCQGAPPP